MPHCLVAVVLLHNETVPRGHLSTRQHSRTVLLEAIECLASVVHSIEHPVSSCKIVLCCTYANVVVFSADFVLFLAVFYPFIRSLVKRCPILIIFGRDIPEVYWLEEVVSFPISPNLCSYTT